ncbi:MAG TPA: DegT/DnrJ/EryC1/StrS family aminotransferase [Flavobacteriales bacterium]|nr:DegT/DnrJ/EryC1/StrS family aminotransferase [Flavobacteriales bacterium]
MIPFSPPRIDEKTVEAVKEVLLSGWITTGPKTKLFEKEITAYCGSKATICLNSATAGLEIMLRWYGVKEGDEVIIPAYTYSATANVVLHCGAKPVMVDVDPNDFNITAKNIRSAINEKTKVIMPVDMAGLPCNYSELMLLVNEKDFKKQFKAASDNQQKLGRILVLCDSAHSFGAVYFGNRVGSQVDAHVFSFHAVKNLTTAEGGAVALNLPAPFDNEEIYKYLCIITLHGQNKDALAKTQPGAWRYDIIEPGYKCNMMDLQAAIGLVELERYDGDTLVRRQEICEMYSEAFAKKNWAQLPVFRSEIKESCYHLYMLRIKGATEEQRDLIIQRITEAGVSVNVHFIPLSMLTAYKNRGYNIADYPITFDNYAREISLPVYYSLTNHQVKTVIEAVIASVEKVLA